jgi:AAA domain
MITPFVPTAEELEWYRLNCAPRELPEDSATLDATPPAAVSPAPAPAPVASHTHSTAAPQALAASTPAIPGQPAPRPPLDECLITAAELSKLKIRRRPALLDRWLCEGDLGYVFAPRGVGKTWMAMALPGAISRGTPLGLWKAGEASLDHEAAALDADLDAPREFVPVPVLYVDGEMPLNRTQERNSGLHLDLSNVTYLHHEQVFETQSNSLNIGEAEDRQRLSDVIIRRGFKVLILDNLSSLAAGIDENKGMDYEPIGHWLLDLRRRQVTVIVVHHAGRNGAMRGHSKREDACSWILELRDARDEGDSGVKFVSHFAKPSRNTGEPMPDLLWHFTTDKESGITDIKCDLAINNEFAKFIQHVCDGVSSQKDLAEMMNKPKGTICKWTRKALKQGLIGGTSTRLQPPVKSSPVRNYFDPEDAALYNEDTYSNDGAEEDGDEGDDD